MPFFLFLGYRARTKRNDFMSLCNGKSNSLWWNAMVGGCPEWSDRKWCFLRLSDLEKAATDRLREFVKKLKSYLAGIFMSKVI